MTPDIDSRIYKFWAQGWSACPLKFGAANPHYERAGTESRAWFSSQNILSGKRDSIASCGYNELLCSRVYPYANYKEFRACCDFINLLYVIDDLTDEMNGEDAADACDMSYQSMVDPGFDDVSPIARMTREFWNRFAAGAKPKCLYRFLGHFRNYNIAVTMEAERRGPGIILDLHRFIVHRRENSAMRVCLTMAEYILGIELPDAVFEDAAFQSVYWAVVDMVCWSNDIYSYHSEQSRGHGANNIITVLMQEKGIDIQSAFDYAGVVFERLMHRYLEDRTRIASLGPEVDADVKRYVDCILHWVVGSIEWSFETPRYFGEQRTEVLRTLEITSKGNDAD